MPIPYSPPTHRRLKVYAFDPMLGRTPLYRMLCEVPYEPLRPGPRGERIEVVDYDSSAQTYYTPVHLEDPYLLMRDGLDPTEADPRFHQQMVYAIASKVLANFDSALGRRLYFRGRKPLKLFPHAFRGANAFFHPRRHAILFGYFPADESRGGQNLPGQPVFTCLSHDIIAHEMTHAITHRLRPFFFEPTNVDVLAFHEAFSDIIAIFQHFSFKEILLQAIQETQSDLRANDEIVKLAQQFGYATGGGDALRTAVDKPDARHLEKELRPHARGSILVAAVFDGFFKTYLSQIQDLLRISTGGTGLLPQGSIHPDLAARLAREACAVADATLRMCIRAFDYLPPVDVTFGDFLRALVTADFELNPRGELGLRRNLIEAFRIRGIYPENVRSLAEDSLLWERAAPAPSTPEDISELLAEIQQEMILEAAATSRNSSLDWNPAAGADDDAESRKNRYPAIHAWARRHATALGLHPGLAVQVAGLHPSFRVGIDGQLLVEVIVQLLQRAEASAATGGIPLRGGATVVLNGFGQPRYVIAKPLPGAAAPFAPAAAMRQARQTDYAAALTARDTFHIWQDEEFQKIRLRRLMGFAALHGGAL